MQGGATETGMGGAGGGAPTPNMAGVAGSDVKEKPTPKLCVECNQRKARWLGVCQAHGGFSGEMCHWKEGGIMVCTNNARVRRRCAIAIDRDRQPRKSGSAAPALGLRDRSRPAALLSLGETVALTRAVGVMQGRIQGEPVESANFCIRHGGGKRCEHEGCIHVAKVRSPVASSLSTRSQPAAGSSPFACRKKGHRAPPSQCSRIARPPCAPIGGDTRGG